VPSIGFYASNADPSGVTGLATIARAGIPITTRTISASAPRVMLLLASL